MAHFLHTPFSKIDFYSKQDSQFPLELQILQSELQGRLHVFMFSQVAHFVLSHSIKNNNIIIIIRIYIYFKIIEGIKLYFNTHLFQYRSIQAYNCICFMYL